MRKDAKARLAIQSDGEFARIFAPHRICDGGARMDLAITAAPLSEEGAIGDRCGRG
jgi:hypothetical protein